MNQSLSTTTKYYKLEDNSIIIRSTYPEEIAKEAAKQVNIQENMELHTLLTTDKSKKQSSCLQFLQPKQK